MCEVGDAIEFSLNSIHCDNGNMIVKLRESLNLIYISGLTFIMLVD